MIRVHDSTRGQLRHVRDAIVARWFVVSLVGALSVAVLTLLWVANRAFTGWQRSAALLSERRAEEKATLLSVALERDMKAVQGSVLGGFGERRLGFRDPYDLFDIVASAFSRYPYADSIFVWRVESQSVDGRLYVFNRVDRPPIWAADLQRPSRFPVALIVDPQPMMPMMGALRASNTREQFVLTEIIAAGVQYQVVASLFFDRGRAQSLAGAVGFLVDLTWVRRHYFGELLKEVETVIGENGVNLSILDEHSTPVASSGTTVEQGISFERRFPLAFFDRSLLAAESKLATIPVWTIRVTSSVNAGSTVQPWRALWWLMSLAAVASLVSVILIAQSVRAIAENAAARSEFLATVTHDLKTPLALVRAVGETLEYGRYPPDRRIDEYGRLLRLEASRLTLRIDNLLAFARAGDARQAYRADTVDLLDVIHESLHRAEPRMAGFELDENLADAPLVVGDPTALVQMFDNLIDNAIKYSGDTKHIGIRTATEGASVVVAIQDRGTGIAPADLTRVFEKFFRGSHQRSGSGLGLAIAQTIVRAHRGTIDIASELGHGTTVTVKLPLSHTI
jgi:signal transduction histidine kinase